MPKEAAAQAHQQNVDMIPLMMQQGYKANGWLGLILGTRLYGFHFSSVTFRIQKAHLVEQVLSLLRERH